MEQAQRTAQRQLLLAQGLAHSQEEPNGLPRGQTALALRIGTFGPSSRNRILRVLLLPQIGHEARDVATRPRIA